MLKPRTPGLRVKHFTTEPRGTNHIAQKAPIYQNHIYRQIKILRTIFEKGHPRNIPVKLFQNLTSSFGEENFLRISSCCYSARSPHSPEPCLWTDQNFANNF